MVHKEPDTNETEDESLVNRRSILAKTAVGAGSIIAATGTTSASSNMPRQRARAMRDQFADVKAKEAAFNDHATALVEAFESSDLDVNLDPVDVHTAATTDTKVGVVEGENGLTTHLQTSLSVTNGKVSAVVLPDEGTTYAFYRPDDGPERVVKPDAPGRQFETTTAMQAGECRYASCSGWGNPFVSGSVFEYKCLCIGECDSDDCVWDNTGDCCDPDAP